MRKIIRLWNFYSQFLTAWLEVNSEKGRNMLKKIFNKKAVIAALALAYAGNAEAAPFEIDKAKSYIKFEAVQNGAPVTGEFKDFSGVVNFDPKKADTSNATLEIKTGSVSASYGEMADTLKTPEWFDATKFPVAKFVVEKFTFVSIDEHPFSKYKAEGKLTIRDVTMPVKLDLTLIKYKEDEAIVEATNVISRNKFGVGQGEWKDTSAVKDEVKVMVHLEMKAKK